MQLKNVYLANPKVEVYGHSIEVYEPCFCIQNMQCIFRGY